jgi:hypothetical protein
MDCSSVEEEEEEEEEELSRFPDLTYNLYY